MRTNLKNHLFTTLIAATVLLSSCLTEDDLTVDNTFSFLDQNLQGLINGVPFAAGEGTAEVSGNDLSIDIYDTTEDISEICSFFGFGDQVNIFFNVPNAVGIYELGIDFTDLENGQSVTLYDPNDSDAGLNIIATQGAVEILTITETEVTGRLDARADEQTIVNGNFTLTICSN